MGLNIPGNRASICILDLKCTIPVLGSSPDYSYAPVLSVGSTFIGGGTSFVLNDVVDFSSDVNSNNIPNRTIIPQINNAGVIQSYVITKREVIYNGSYKFLIKNITPNEYKPFYSITLPDNNVVQIDSIINIPGFSYNSSTASNIQSSMFYDPNYRFYEVDYLMQDRIFTTSDATSTPQAGTWQMITKKFIKEFTVSNLCKITFGNGNPDLNLFQTAVSQNAVYNGYDSYLQNTSLGEIPQLNSQIIIRYIVGGGSSSNVGANTITTVGTLNYSINGNQDSINQQVIRSISCNNPIQALGGSDAPSVETIRNLIKYNFASQNRCVTLNDYLLTTLKMPGEYGSAFRVNTMLENNKVVVSVIGLNSLGQLDNTSTSILKTNISNWLSGSRMVNDYVEVRDGQIYNISCEFDLYIDSVTPSNEIATNAITTVQNYFDIQSNQMGVDIQLADLISELNKITGIINVIDYRFYNKIGNGYSLNQVPQPYVVGSTNNEIDLINNTLYNSEDGMFEILNAGSDITLYLKKSNQLPSSFNG